MGVYPIVATPTTVGPTVDRPERRGVSCRTVVGEAKAKVSVVGLTNHVAADTKWRKSGDEWVTRSPLPDHEDRTPSFAVNPEANVWFCHGCLRGGDVVELARYCWNYSKDEVAGAAAQLLEEFGHDIPSKPAAWYRKQERQTPIRDALERVKIEGAQRRLYRWMCAPAIAQFEDEHERRLEEAIAWEECGFIARMVASAVSPASEVKAGG